jgi:putative membrane protein
VPPAPSAAGVLTQWHLAVVPALAVVAMLAAYGVGVRRAATAGTGWSKLRTGTFVVLGVGSYAVTTLGFLGVYSPYLRWAFAAQSALLLLVVPALIALGRPIELARKALGDNGRRQLDAFLGSRLVRVLSHPIGGPALLLVMLLLFLTPLPPEVRSHAWAVAVTQILLPVFGLMALVTVASGEEPASTSTMAIGFLIAFFELIADALPGILLRLHNGIIGTLAIPGSRPPWLPTALRDQQLSGDVLWFLGEAIDLPFLAWLVVRWIRADAKEAAVVDAQLDAEQHDDRPWWEVERRDGPGE